MPRKGYKRPETFAGDLSDAQGLAARLREYVEWMRVHNYSELTIYKYRQHANDFRAWCEDRLLMRPDQISRAMLERYQHWLYGSQDGRGHLMSYRNQYERMGSVRSWFKWMARQEYVETSPAADVQLPQLPHRLPPVLLRP